MSPCDLRHYWGTLDRRVGGALTDVVGRGARRSVDGTSAVRSSETWRVRAARRAVDGVLIVLTARRDGADSLGV